MLDTYLSQYLAVDFEWQHKRVLGEANIQLRFIQGAEKEMDSDRVGIDMANTDLDMIGTLFLVGVRYTKAR